MRRGVWVLLGLGAILAVLSSLEKLPGAASLGLADTAWAAWIDAARSGPARLALSVGTVALVARAVQREGASRAVPALFVLLFLLAHAEAAAGLPNHESVRHGKVLPGAVLAAVALGRRLGRRDDDGGERRALGFAAGAAAALYGSAGLVKIAHGGLAWGAGSGVGMLIYERSYSVPGAWSDLRRAFGTQPVLASAGAWSVMVVELLGLGLVVPRLRAAYAALATVMHVTIFVLLGYLYAEWWLSLWGLALWTRAVARGPAPTWARGGAVERSSSATAAAAPST